MAQPAPAARRTPFPYDLLAVATLAIAVLITFGGSLRYFFTQDDFTGLARVRGLLPPLSGPWRYVSGQLYFEVMKVVAGLNPLPYRIVSLVAHATTVAVLFALLRRSATVASAWVGALWFAVHVALYTAIYSVSGIGEILTGLFGVATLLAVGMRGAWRWTAIAWFALSLLSKETTVLLPFVLLAVSLPGDETGVGFHARLRDPVRLTLAGISIAYVGLLLQQNTFGIRSALDPRAPYAVRFDHTVLDNGFTYLAWTVNFLLVTVRDSSDRANPSHVTTAIAVLAAWLLGLAWPSLRRRGWLAGGLLFLAFLVPVLPLPNHTYHYYLYAPLTGAALCVAALADAVAARVLAPSTRTAPERRHRPDRSASRAARKSVTTTSPASSAPALLAVVSGIAGTVLVVNGAMLVRKIEHYPYVGYRRDTGQFVDPDLRADPTVDRARIARNVVTDLQSSTLPRNVSLWLWSPVSRARQLASGSDTTYEGYWETNVRSALYDGLAIRMFVPDVRRVRFVRWPESAGDSVRYAVYRPDGHLRVATPAELDSVMHAMGIGG